VRRAPYHSAVPIAATALCHDTTPHKHRFAHTGVPPPGAFEAKPQGRLHPLRVLSLVPGNITRYAQSKAIGRLGQFAKREFPRKKRKKICWGFWDWDRRDKFAFGQLLETKGGPWLG